MILRFHQHFRDNEFWTDEAIASLVGQKTTIADCPAKVIRALRCVDENTAMDITFEVDNAYESYIEMMMMFRKDALYDSISVIKEE